MRKFMIKRRKSIIAAIISLAVGATLGFTGGTTQEEIDVLLAKNETISIQVKEQNSVIKESNEKLDSLNEEIKELEAKKLEQEKIEKEEAEKKAKEESERKAREEADRLAREDAERKAQEEALALANSQQDYNSSNAGTGYVEEEPIGQLVWKTKSGSKYHSRNNCGNTDSASASQITVDQAISNGLGPCSKCF
ncbi:hypothetical protein [Clostridium sp.]|uniref:hypothetical protein n=1 Tax=Clostridium sp. TaxID=1506 RepID=UPI003F406AF7